jgi:hypothetical protein
MTSGGFSGCSTVSIIPMACSTPRARRHRPVAELIDRFPPVSEIEAVEP